MACVIGGGDVPNRGGSLWAFLYRGQPHNVTYDGLRAIQVGMTEAEVQGVFGGPPGDYGSGPIITYGSGFGGEVKPSSRVEHWQGDDIGIHVGFDDEGKVCGLGLYPLMRGAPEPSLIERARAWLGW